MNKRLTHKEVETFLLDYKGAWLDYPFGEEVAVYKVGSKMFALIAEGKDPVRISLKCDPKLAVKLRNDYEEVMPGYHLNKKHWNTIVLSGQLNTKEIKDLIRLSYDLVVNNMTSEERSEIK